MGDQWLGKSNVDRADLESRISQDTHPQKIKYTNNAVYSSGKQKILPRQINQNKKNVFLNHDRHWSASDGGKFQNPPTEDKKREI